jgi:hypothetical protein
MLALLSTEGVRVTSAIKEYSDVLLWFCYRTVANDFSWAVFTFSVEPYLLSCRYPLATSKK